MIIVRYSEIGLKGKNRGFFEKKLISNIKAGFKKNNLKFKDIKRLRGRILIDTDKGDFLKNIFGISSYSYTKEVDLDLEKIRKEAKKLVGKEKTFRVSTQRIDKIFLDSQKLNYEVGAVIDKKVDLSNPELEIFIEIFNNHAYVFKEKFRGLGGLPVGVSGEVYIISKDWKGLVVGYLLMKRGCRINFVKKRNIKSLAKFSYGNKIRFVKTPKDAFIANDETVDSLKNNNYLKPLLGYSEKEIKEIYNKII